MAGAEAAVVQLPHGDAGATAPAPGMVYRGRVVRVFERRSQPKPDGSTFTTDVIALFSSRGGEEYIEASRSKDGSRNPIVELAESLAPDQGQSELGGWIEIPVYVQAWKDRVYIKASFAR